MSSSKEPVKKELLPFQENSVTSNQQSVPLPYFAGTRLLAGTWISDALNPTTHQVPKAGKKG